ncbi:MAG: DUF3090 domain-containing protein [Propionibacteriaceae bacterium]
MAILVHRYDSPDRFVAGTVGQPGERTFFLQAREGNRITSVVVEKQQVSVLAEHLDKVLDEVLRRSGPAADVPPAQEKPSDFDPLDAPITEEFRVGTMTIAWDAEINKIVIELFSNVDDEDETEDLGDDLDLPAAAAAAALEAAEEVDADEVFVVKISAAYARDFVARAQALVSAGRPPCPFCLQPLDPAGHICPRANGYRRPLF